MDFDKDEKDLNFEANHIRNLIRKLDDCKEVIIGKEYEINKIQAKLFFLDIDNYLLRVKIDEMDELDAELETEFQELNS